LGQIKELARLDNLVNMDTRTVLSCVPFALPRYEGAELREIGAFFQNQALFRSLFVGDGVNHLPELYQWINDHKMFRRREAPLIPLRELKHWRVTPEGIFCDHPYPFEVIYCDIAIEGREVARWTQPLLAALGKAVLGLLTQEVAGVTRFLVRLKPEFGCFDQIEIGPTLQKEATEADRAENAVEELFLDRWRRREGVLHDTLLSEEGGRFYQEENHNVILALEPGEPLSIPEDYVWVDYRTLNLLTQVNNCLNIPLRNLLVLLEA
jgi:oxidase EvaA